VSNRLYLKRCVRTILELRLFGGYRGDIVVIVGDDLKKYVELLETIPLQLLIKYFPDIERSGQISQIMGRAGSSGTEITKGFQYHKLYLFHVWLKNWDRVLYIDSGMRIFNKIQPILDLKTDESLIAHSDSFPEHITSLISQFNVEGFPNTESFVLKVGAIYQDYFQTGVLLYDTKIIDESTFNQLNQFLDEFPNSKTNDQGIVNLWALQKRIWRRLPTEKIGKHYLYDYWERGKNKSFDYLMLKYPQTEGLIPRLCKRLIFEFFWVFFIKLSLKTSLKRA